MQERLLGLEVDLVSISHSKEEKHIPVLMDLRDIYSLNFLPNPHYVYLGYENDKCTSVVAGIALNSTALLFLFFLF
jgi:hypothetical protein